MLIRINKVMNYISEWSEPSVIREQYFSRMFHELAHTLAKHYKPIHIGDSCDTEHWEIRVNTFSEKSLSEAAEEIYKVVIRSYDKHEAIKNINMWFYNHMETPNGHNE